MEFLPVAVPPVAEEYIAAGRKVPAGACQQIRRALVAERRLDRIVVGRIGKDLVASAAVERTAVGRIGERIAASIAVGRIDVASNSRIDKRSGPCGCQWRDR